MPKKDAPPPRPWTADLEADLRRLLSVGEECISERELRALLLARGRGSAEHAAAQAGAQAVAADATDGGSASISAPPPPFLRMYDGFEPSGRMHIAQGLLKAVNVNKCTHEGTRATFVFWVADWFALMNDKMGGDLAAINVVGQYLIEVWRAAGMDLAHVEFRWASAEITARAAEYWPLVLDVARRFNITRVKKCCQIMGRREGSLSSAQVLYPLMQCADVFFLKADICQLGVDQRKVNMLAREYADAAKRRHKPVILSHHMLYGLKEGQEKMSKSDPDSAVFMEDTREDVERKILGAYCPTREAVDEGEGTANTEPGDAGLESMHLAEDRLKNPVLDYVRHIVLAAPGAVFCCATAAAPGGREYTDADAVRADFLRGEISPDQLKRGLIDALNARLEPVREHFAQDATARGLFEQVKEFKRRAAAPVETSPKDTVPKVPRLDLVAAGVVPAGSHLVPAPLPCACPTLQSAADTLARLRAGAAPRVLLLSDWTAHVHGSLDADPKLIAAYHAVLLAALRALDVRLHGEERAIMKDVTVVTQSEAILEDPSGYWISVINAGRHFSLDTVMGATAGPGGGMKDSDGVGQVIGRLMLVADVLAVNPRSVALVAATARREDCSAGAAGLTAEADAAGQKSAVEGVKGLNLKEGKEGGAAAGEGDAASALLSVEAHLVREFYATKLSHPGLVGVLPQPQITYATDGPRLGLQPPRESAGHRLESDEYFLADDPKVHGKSKVKKAFCEPGNVGFCPPIELLAYFGGLPDNKGSSGEEGGGGGEVTIPRSPENGGTVTYRTKADLLADFASGALHPGDLKATVATMMVEVLTRTSAEIKEDAAAAKGVKALKAFEKKMAKRKKK